MKKHMNQKGFTLIELMIVVAIIGILAAIAIPSYRDYTVKATASKLVASLAGQKVKLGEIYDGNGALACTYEGLTVPNCTISGTNAVLSMTDGAITADITLSPPANAGEDLISICELTGTNGVIIKGCTAI
jgi:type IV pilus assembly protein PilA